MTAMCVHVRYVRSSAKTFLGRGVRLPAVRQQRLVNIVVIVVKIPCAVGHRPHCAARREGR